MSKRHDAIFDDVLKGIDAKPISDDRGGARFLKRSNALAESGEREEKLLRWVEPEVCVMWARHNRAYAELTPENCDDLISSMRAQGRQEFPAVVRRLPAGAPARQDGAEYEVICGARRHFAVTWLKAHNYPQFRYLIEVRDLTDEEAFRLADLENRDREDISDLERARDYAGALDHYYGGSQKAMAERLEVSEAWLSRYLKLAELPPAIVAAFASIRDLRELHARTLRPLLSDDATAGAVLAAAAKLAGEQALARQGKIAPVLAPTVVARLKAAAEGPRSARSSTMFRPDPKAPGLEMRRRAGKVLLEFKESMPEAALRAALDAFLAAQYQKR